MKSGRNIVRVNTYRESNFPFNVII